MIAAKSRARARWPRAAMPFVLILALAACAPVKMYPGPELPPDKTALILPMGPLDHLGQQKGWDKLLGRSASLSVETIDGMKPEPGYDFGIRVMPGRHTLAVNLFSCGSTPHYIGGTIIYVASGCRNTPTKEIALETEAGHRYLVLGKRVSKDQVYWIEDQETGRVVAGRKPK